MWGNSQEQIQYVFNNIQTEFSLFMSEIQAGSPSARNKPFAKSYPGFYFEHNEDIGSNMETQHKFTRRSNRFQTALREEELILMVNLRVGEISSVQAIAGRWLHRMNGSSVSVACLAQQNNIVLRG